MDKLTREDFEGINNEWYRKASKLLKENERYRKALEEIASLMNYNGNADIVAIEIAEEALKGDETA